MPDPSSGSFDHQYADRVADVVIEGYRNLRVLGIGGQAIVYLALHEDTRKKVALKVLLPPYADASDTARRRFELEVKIAAELNHPNIVTIHDTGVYRKQYYYAMDYIRGQPLDSHVTDKALTLAGKMALFLKICNAMAYAHQHGVIHRDLKPSNILVDDRGEPHVLDFGVAKTTAGLHDASARAAVLTRTGYSMGTIPYMSPEQAAGQWHLADVRTDVYALGVVLYEMCTGQLPYGPADETELRRRIRDNEIIPPRKIIPRLDSDVETIILKCLEKDPERRYGTARELKEDIGLWLAGDPILAKRSLLYQITKKARKRKRSLAIVMLLLLIVCSLGFIAFDQYLKALKAKMETEAVMGASSPAARALFFKQFLESWQSRDPNRLDQAKGLARIIRAGSSGSIERQGADFLLDPQATADVSPLLKKLPSPMGWFAHMIAGEWCVRQGNLVQADDAYRRSRDELVKTGPPFWQALYQEHIDLRLYQLRSSGTGPSSGGIPADGKEERQ